jgi:hypothetical protein
MGMLLALTRERPQTESLSHEGLLAPAEGVA